MLRRFVSVLVALVLMVQGALALAAPPCVHADDAPARAAEHAGHGARHDGHDMHAMHDGAPSKHGCGDDCRCADSCAASGLHAIALPAPAWPAAYTSLVPNRLPDTQRAPAHASRLLRPPIPA
jgi:hypothetical protein